MSWAFGVNLEGHEVGYTVEAECDETGCMKRIDRGLAYACGDAPDGGEHGCGLFFCYDHLLMGGPVQLCKQCIQRHSKLPIEECGDENNRCVVHEATGKVEVPLP